MKFATTLIAASAASATAASPADSDSALAPLRRTEGLLARVRGEANVDSLDQAREMHHRRLQLQEYEMSVKYDHDKIKIESETPTVELDFEIKAASPLSIKMDFEETLEDAEIETKSRALIHYVQEWRDLNSNGIMDVNEKVGKAYKIGSRKGGYNDIYPEPPKNPTSFNFTIEEANNGPVTLIGHVVAVENEFYDPSSFKFDLLINDWQYQDAQTNQLAVLIELRMETEMEYEEDDKNGAIAQAACLAYSVFEWRTDFQYGDNQEGDIGMREATKAELDALRISTKKGKKDEARSFVWYSFGVNEAYGASDIFWDPSIGVRSADVRRSLASASVSASQSSSFSSQSTGAFAGVVAGAVAGVAIVGALAFAVVKRMGGERSAVAAKAAAKAVATEEAPESGL